MHEIVMFIAGPVCLLQWSLHLDLFL